MTCVHLPLTHGEDIFLKNQSAFDEVTSKNLLLDPILLYLNASCPVFRQWVYIAKILHASYNYAVTVFDKESQYERRRHFNNIRSL